MCKTHRIAYDSFGAELAIEYAALRERYIAECPLNVLSFRRDMTGSTSNLVVVRAGDQSLHPTWMLPKEQRSWDLVISYFGDDPDRYRSPDVVRIDHKGSKWQGLSVLFESGQIDLSGYRNIWLPDDDLAIHGKEINRFFHLFDKLGLELAQPALHWDSYFSLPITLRNPTFEFRHVNFVEQMAPCFRHDLFEKVRHTFFGTISGWGIDVVWQQYLSRPIGGAAIIDSVEMVHTRPVGGPNYAHLAKQEITALDEMKQTLAKYRVSEYSTRVFGAQTHDGQWLTIDDNREQLFFDCINGVATRLAKNPTQLGLYALQLLSAASPGSVFGS